MRIFKEMFIIALGVVAFVYLVNPTLGVFELMPDNLPLVGNIDEGGASLVLLAVARYYGIDLTRILGSRGQSNQQQQQQLPPRT